MTELQLPDMVNNYIMFCNYKNSSKKSKILDLSWSDWLYPTTLLPLGVFIKTNRSIRFQPPYNENVAKYISLVTQDIDLTKIDNKTYIPIINLPDEEEKSEKILKFIYKLHNKGKGYGGELVFKYLINELVDNIYQHSEFKNALVMAQRYEKKGFAEICFFDDGMTINGSFLKKGMIFSDSDAIIKALNGLSSKSKDRGYGLSSNLNLFVNGLKGELFIVSGNGAVYYTKKTQKIYRFQDKYRLNGTLISVRIPYPAKDVNLYDYIR